MSKIKLRQLKDGDTIILDGGFTCKRAGRVKVEEDDYGLFFTCSDGHHYLVGQYDEKGYLIGITKS
jgi:hypothetical protein